MYESTTTVYTEPQLRISTIINATSILRGVEMSVQELAKHTWMAAPGGVPETRVIRTASVDPLL